MLFEMSKRALDIFATKKSSVFSSTRWTFKASREARRRTAAFSIRLAGNYTRPASREACRRAAVKPRPSRMSLYTPARIARSPKGAQPLLLSVMTTWRLGSSPSLWVETFSFFCRALCRMRRS